jgi:hypothetical protein
MSVPTAGNTRCCAVPFSGPADLVCDGVVRVLCRVVLVQAEARKARISAGFPTF